MATAYLSPGVYVEEVDKGSKPIEGVGTAIAAFVGFAEKGPVGEPTLVTNWSQFQETFGGFVDGVYLAHSVYGYFSNGGGVAYVNRIPGAIGAAAQNGKATAALPAPSLALPGKDGNPQLEVTASKPDAGDVKVDVRAADAGAPDDQFTIVVRQGETEETFANVTFGKGKGAKNVVETLNKESKLVKVAEKESAAAVAERVPTAGTYALAKATASALAATAKAELPAVSQADFIGDAAERTGINGLEVLDNVTMVVVPDAMAAFQAGKISEESLRGIQTALINHCELMHDRVAIVDAPPGMNAQKIREWRMNTAGYDSKYAALYYPWIKVSNPLGDGSITVPPSGHMAGVWARSDGERGVHKAPANEVIRGVTGLEIQISRGEQDTLNPNGINCIRAFPGRGIRVWGARTLSSDPSWRYINVRRLFNYVEKSIEGGTQWVVFEPNDMALWERVKRDVGAFLDRCWMSGALFGSTAAESYFVKCDAELNPVSVRDAGQLIIEIGIAPVKPAEFVIFRISQYTPGA